MKKLPKRLWVWVLSGLATVLGGCCLINGDVSALYGPPKVYGPPPPENPYGSEKLYGPPAPDDVTEPQSDTLEEPGEYDMETPADSENAL